MRGLLAALTAAATLVAPAPHHDATTQIRVLSLNIFYGGDELDLATGDFCATPDGCPATLRQVERVIRASGADIVGLQEPERNTERIAADLGWHGSNHAHVMSRFPIVDPPGADGRYVFVEVTPGKVVAVANTHLPSDPYGPYLVRDGGTKDEVLELERSVRLPAVRDLARTLPALAAKGIPVVLTGDFNSPSPLDWTPAVAKVRPDVPYPVRWPAGAALLDAGLADTYREAHPDPVRDPGFTWTPGGPESDPHEVFDRIDWVLRAGPARTVASRVVGEQVVSPYPTDHRGVVSTLDTRPAPPPVLVAPAARRVTLGDAVAVRFHAPASSHVRVELRDPHGRTVAAAGTGGRRDGEVRLPTRGLARGEHEVALVSGDGAVLTRTGIWVYPAGEPTQVSTARSSVRKGEPIGVRWSNAPGMGLDWIAVYRVGADAADYLTYEYTGGRVEGGLTIDSGSLSPGRYVLRLLPDDGYRAVAESRPFTVA
ncbi:endonuclease/exonuclease/phosphatase family protein [Actinoplanes sp. CA-142083]|uniref:endonuclease/exonuclease/phosphatase family protein n=1 Tax=Actinoplanes sp. CA-142083 TaxID=3239903 RepID=UPI003D90DAD7